MVIRIEFNFVLIDWIPFSMIFFKRILKTMPSGCYYFKFSKHHVFFLLLLLIRRFFALLSFFLIQWFFNMKNLLISKLWYQSINQSVCPLIILIFFFIFGFHIVSYHLATNNKIKNERFCIVFTSIITCCCWLISGLNFIYLFKEKRS